MDNFTERKTCIRGHSLKKKVAMFALPDIGFMPGLVCRECNALYETEEWMSAVSSRANIFNSKSMKTDKYKI